MQTTPTDVLADISRGLEGASARVHYASSDEDLFYVIRLSEGTWMASPIADERHEVLLGLKRTGQLLEGHAITVSASDGFRFVVHALRPVA